MHNKEFDKDIFNGYRDSELNCYIMKNLIKSVCLSFLLLTCFSINCHSQEVLRIIEQGLQHGVKTERMTNSDRALKIAYIKADSVLLNY